MKNSIKNKDYFTEVSTVSKLLNGLCSNRFNDSLSKAIRLISPNGFYNYRGSDIPSGYCVNYFNLMVIC